MLMLGWHTAAIVPEVAREIRYQNDEDYQKSINWIEYLTLLVEKYQKYSQSDPQIKALIREWLDERAEIRFFASFYFQML